MFLIRLSFSSHNYEHIISLFTRLTVFWGFLNRTSGTTGRLRFAETGLFDKDPAFKARIKPTSLLQDMQRSGKLVRGGQHRRPAEASCPAILS